MSRFAQKISKFSRNRLALLCTELKARLDKAENSPPEPIAITGMACRFPGEATDLESFWELLHKSGDAIVDIPPDRWDVDAFYDAHPDAPGKAYCRHGGFLHDIDQFDPFFFNISPREAVSLDPQYRLLLEVTWEALEIAGQNPHELRGTRSGVFVGVGTDDYAKIQIRLGDPESITAYTGTGNAYCYGVGRLSYFLGLQGPNFPVDTACSSSLVVTHLACQSLRAGECDLALAGGVHLMLSPVGTIFLCKARALSAEGRCRTFDARADGFVRGEGCGIIVLKRLSDAIANRDRIYAVICGSAVNHDGPSSGFTVPNGPAQRAVIQAALRMAQVEPLDVGYVEAHGTGTALGDPIEVRSIAATLGRKVGRSRDNPLVLGSVKTNFGHLESAAGVAGLIKTVLALQHNEIPPHLHLEKVNPHIALEEGPFIIPTQPLPWPPSERRRIAGVSSFGLSGTNAHVILRDATLRQERTERFQRGLQVLTLSARTESALRTLAGRFERHLAMRPAQSLANICFTANTGRAHFAHRLAVVTDSADQLQAELKAFSQAGKTSALMSGKVETGTRSRVAFLFSGEGCQYLGMGGQLYASEPRFREAIQQCEEVLGADLEPRLSEILFAERDDRQLFRQPLYAHAALFALEYALVQLWRSWGIDPSAVLGHGLGEYVAAVVAGVFTVKDGLELLLERARLVQSLSSAWQTATVMTDEHQVQAMMESLAGEGAVVAINSGENVVISGPEPALKELVKRLKKDGVKVRLTPGGGVLYSSAALPILDRLEERAAKINFQPPRIRMISTLTGDVVGGEVAQARHWSRHACQPVGFAAGMKVLYGRGYDNFLEIGPTSLLTRWGKQCLPHRGLQWQASLRRQKDWHQMLTSLSRFYIRGLSIDWSGLDGPYQRERVPLPTYPFERQRFWLEVSRPARSAVLVSERDALKDASMRPTIERLLRVWGEDGAQAINRRVTAPLIFLSSTGQSFFYLNQKGSCMVIQAAVGPPESFDFAAREVRDYARSRNLNLMIFASGERVDKLKKLGFTTTPIGVWQGINDLKSFSIHAKGMRRLRSKVNSYRNRGSCSTEEYRVGSEGTTDRRIVDLMDSWVTRKRRKAPFVALLKEEILASSLDSKYRIFLTRRLDEIDSVLLLAPIEAKNGYLLDLEFYPVKMPSGCLEFGIINTMEQLKGEGISYYSLGSSFGTQLVFDPHEDRRVRDLLQSFHREGILNDDGIFEFKKKFRPTTFRLYVCCLPETDLSVLPEVLMMLAAPENISHQGEPPSSLVAQPLQGPLEPGAGGAAPPKTVYPERPALREPHPLLGHRIPLALRDAVFESRLELGSRESTWLADHRILDNAVLPAAAYVEMAMAASTAIFRRDRHSLEDLSFLEALTLPEQGQRIVQLTLSAKEDGAGSFRISSKRGESGGSDSDWTLHATGIVQPIAERSHPSRQQALSLEDIRRQQLQVIEAESYYHQVGQFGLQYGSSFRAIQELWNGYGEALASVSLPNRLLPEMEKYQIHPILLDACLQVQGAALLASLGEQKASGIYLPVSIRRVSSHRRLETKLWVHCRLSPAREEDLQEIVGDIQVFDESGRLVAGVDGLAVRRTSRDVLQLLTKERPGKMFYQVEWRPQRRRRMEKAKVVEKPGRWVIFADAGGTAVRLAELLQERGEDCLTVYPNETLDTSAPDCWRLNPSEPKHFQQVFKEGSRLRRVVYLWSADPMAPEELNLASLRRAQVTGCQGLLHLLQALTTVERTGSRQLWVVTRGVQPAGGVFKTLNPAQAPIWGLGRTVSQEHPEIWGGMIDLESHASASEAELLLEEIWDPEEEDHLAFRGGQRYIARLMGKETWKSTAALQLRPDATYMITGGLGGLGLTVARWMVARGARHLLLVGRRAASQEVQEILAELEQAGAQEVVYHQADVSGQEEVAGLLAQVAPKLPALRGIVHAAGVLADGTLLQQSWSRFLEVMAAKIDGSWHLHNLTRDLALDHFILFSSSASILGAAGQGNYAAANTFMDALAHLRQVQGLPALSINWGPWSEVGMSAALDPRAQAQRASQGIRPISPAEGLRLLEQAMSELRPQVGIISVDWEKLTKAASPVLRRSSLFKDVLAAAASVRGEKGEGPSQIVKELLNAARDARRLLLQSYIVERVAHVLGAQPANINQEETLTLQGFDSLMALELRERLEAELQISIPILNFFRDNSVAELTAFLLKELARKYPDALSEPVEEESPQELLARLHKLSDGEVDAALRRMTTSRRASDS